MATTNMLRSAWNGLSRLPAGKRLFSKLVGAAAPYTGSMGAQVVELRDGFARVRLADRRKVRNHLDCVHAIALANLAELTGNVAMAYSMPKTARFIVAGMSIDYVKKARGPITAEALCPVPETSEKITYEVPVVMRNESGEDVARATLRTLIGPIKKRS
jgi:uncharacterized protein (TIGR00369 family)